MSSDPTLLRKSLAEKVFYETISPRVRGLQFEGRYAVDLVGYSTRFDFAFPEKQVAVEITDESSDPSQRTRIARALDAGWAVYAYRVEEVLAGTPKSNGMYTHLLFRLGVTLTPKRYLCEFAAGWNPDGNEYGIVEAADEQDLIEKIKKRLAEQGIGHPENYPNERKNHVLRFSAVHSYEIANTVSFDVSSYVSVMETQEKELYEKLRQKHEIKEYERLKVRYAPKSPPEPTGKHEDYERYDW